METQYFATATDRHLSDWKQAKDKNPRIQFASCCIKYMDNGMEVEVIIAITEYNDAWNSDDNIFYYVSSLEELEFLKEKCPVVDFIVTEIYGIYDEI